MKDVIVKSEFSIRLLNDGSFLDVYAMPKDNTPFDMSILLKKETVKKIEIQFQSFLNFIFLNIIKTFCCDYNNQSNYNNYSTN